MLKTPHLGDISALYHGKSRTLEKSVVLQCPGEVLVASSKQFHISVAVGHVQKRRPLWRRVLHAVVYVIREAEVKALSNQEAHAKALVY